MSLIESNLQDQLLKLCLSLFEQNISPVWALHHRDSGLFNSHPDLRQGHLLVSSAEDATFCHTQKTLDQVLDIQDRSLVRCFIQNIMSVFVPQNILLLYISNTFYRRHIRTQILLPLYISHQIISLKSYKSVCPLFRPDYH